jgi:hypothetical protein
VSVPGCSAASLEAEESLLGTAVESVDRWLLLEVTDPWAPKALQSEALPDAVRARLAEWLEVSRTRLQLVRRPGRLGQRRTLALVSTAADRRFVARRELDAYEDLLDVDLETLVMEPPAPICLVCAHGRRDRCCGTLGSAVFRALQARDVEVWQTSHLGGHRFAACALSLPSGLMYGRLRPEHAKDFAAAHEAGRLADLGLFRGRCAHDRPTQAAETFLLQRLSLQDPDAIQWIETMAEADSTWTAHFRVAGNEHAVRVRREQTGQERPASCGGEPEPVMQWVCS